MRSIHLWAAVLLLISTASADAGTCAGVSRQSPVDDLIKCVQELERRVEERGLPTAAGSVDFTFVQFALSSELNDTFPTEQRRWTAPARLRDLLTKTPWSSSEDLREGVVTYKELVLALDTNEDESGQLLRDVEKFESDLPRLRVLLTKAPLSDPERDELYDLWERNDALIYGSVKGDFHRGVLHLADYKPTGQPYFLLARRYFRIKGDEVALYVVNKRGGLYVSALVPSREGDAKLNEYVAQALAFVDQPTLLALLEGVVADVTRNKELAKEILLEISRTRDSYSRWTVQILVANRGSAPVAIFPTADLVVRTAGLSVKGVPLGHDTTVKLHRRQNNRLVPLRVEPGAAEIISYASEKFLAEYPENELLLSAFRIGGADAEIQVALLASGDREQRRLSTIKFRFAENKLD